MMVGVNQIDLISTMVQVIGSMGEESQRELRRNIVLIGGGSVVRGLGERIGRDMVRESPVGS